MKKRITIKDVAAAAGVSRQTVSRAINHQNEISAATKARVWQAIEDLGYQPNRLAQGMVTRRTQTLALLVSDIANPFFPEVARGVQDMARTQGYNVFLCNADGTAVEELETMRLLSAQGVDGIITFASNIEDEALLRFADDYQPLVVINHFIEHPHINLLMVANETGAQLAVDHFVAQGHRHIAMITNEKSRLSQTRRVTGFQRSLAAHNLTNDMITARQPTIDGGYEAAVELFEQQPQVTAVLAYNDLMAIGALRACRTLGKCVPEEVAVIGFDDIQLASVVTPSLSSVHVDKYLIGQMATARLFEMLQQPEKIFPHMFLSPVLTLRDSTKS